MRNYLLILAVAAFGCNSNRQPTKQKEQPTVNGNCFVYPRAVDSLQINDLYDSARWYVYAIHCDGAYLSKRDTSKTVTFGELPLKFNNLNIKGDTLEVNFDFMDESVPYPILPSMTRDNMTFLSGVGFNMKTRKKVYMVSPNGYTVVQKGGANRYENPLQPEVLNYIKNNQEKLDACFKALVKQKGITN